MRTGDRRFIAGGIPRASSLSRSLPAAAYILSVFVFAFFFVLLDDGIGLTLLTQHALSFRASAKELDG